MNKTVYLGISILENSKTMYEFCYDHINPKYHCNAKLLQGYRQLYHTYTEDIADDVKKDLTYQIMKMIDHYPLAKIKNYSTYQR